MSTRWAILAGALVGSALAPAANAGSFSRLYDQSWTRRADAPAPFDWYSIQPSDKIVWTDCEGIFKCARLNLPLNYLDPSDNRTTAIALQLLPAKDRTNFRGTLLLNPGGPGGSGTDFALSTAADIATIVGDGFDIIGFDPRGVGASTPRADCFDTDAERQPWLYGVDDRLLSLEGDTLPIIVAKERVLAQRCEQRIGGPDGIGRFMTSASVARDMLEINKLLGQEKLQYWGFSYGTVLGQYFAAMYPDKVGRLAIDGVYDAVNYREGLWNSNLEAAEDILTAFGEFCFKAGPEKCSFYSGSAEDINARVLAVFDKLDASPIPVALGNTTGVATSEFIREFAVIGLYVPLIVFPLMADVFRDVEAGTTTALARTLASFAPPRCAIPKPWLARTEALNAVACTDAEPLTFSEPEFAAFYRNLSAVSPFVAPVFGELHLKCTVWNVRPVWRYTGEFSTTNMTTPMLVVSPRFDPVTPLGDARRVVARYNGAGLLIQNSLGHSSLAAPSVCTAKHVRAYFQDGTLPPEGTVCEPDELPFLGAVEGGKAKRAMSTEDKELLDALKPIQGYVPKMGYSGRFSTSV